MLNSLKKLFSNSKNHDEVVNIIKDSKNLQIATCAIFLEIAYSDDNFSEVEKNQVFNILEHQFNLSPSEVEQLIAYTEEVRKKSVSLYEFTEIINQYLTQEEKYKIVENLWRIILADNVINAYEEYFIRKISGNLNISHTDLIAAKFAVKEELKNATS